MRVPITRACHCFHDIAGIARMIIAVKSNIFSVFYVARIKAILSFFEITIQMEWLEEIIPLIFFERAWKFSFVDSIRTCSCSNTNGFCRDLDKFTRAAKFAVFFLLPLE